MGTGIRTRRQWMEVGFIQNKCVIPHSDNGVVIQYDVYCKSETIRHTHSFRSVFGILRIVWPHGGSSSQTPHQIFWDIMKVLAASLLITIVKQYVIVNVLDRCLVPCSTEEETVGLHCGDYLCCHESGTAWRQKQSDSTCTVTSIGSKTIRHTALRWLFYDVIKVVKQEGGGSSSRTLLIRDVYCLRI